QVYSRSRLDSSYRMNQHCTEGNHVKTLDIERRSGRQSVEGFGQRVWPSSQGDQ
ncbi:unnamed protein product, partial [Musa textilis]